MSNRPVARWRVNLYVECPACKKDVDLTDHEDFWSNNDELELASKGPADATCPKCGHEFECELEW